MCKGCVVSSRQEEERTGWETTGGGEERRGGGCVDALEDMRMGKRRGEKNREDTIREVMRYDVMPLKRSEERKGEGREL